MRALAILGTLLMLCAAPDAAHARMRPWFSAPSIEQARADAAAEGACVGAPLRPPYIETPPGRPRTLRVCPPVYPRELLNREIVGRCFVLFDVDASGAPQILQTKCIADNVIGRDRQTWLPYAEAAFGARAERAISQWRYNALADAAPGERRSRLMTKITFQTEDSQLRALPAPFEDALDVGGDK